jgi:hypothetical protein
MLPIQALCLLSLGSFYVPIDDLSGRLSVSLALVLTVVEYHATAAQDLPKISYLTFLDMHLLSSLIFTFLVTAANIVSSQHGSLGENVDFVCLTILTLLHAATWFCFAAAGWVAIKHADEMMNRHESGEKIRTDNADGDGASLAHISDTAVRVLKNQLSRAPERPVKASRGSCCSTRCWMWALFGVAALFLLVGSIVLAVGIPKAQFAVEFDADVDFIGLGGKNLDPQV